MRLGSEAAVAERPFVTARQAFLSPWTGRDKKGEGCGERKGSVAGPGGLSGPVGILPFNFCGSVYTLCLFGMSVGRRRVLPVEGI